jgi:hypothetical protein
VDLSVWQRRQQREEAVGLIHQGRSHIARSSAAAPAGGLRKAAAAALASTQELGSAACGSPARRLLPPCMVASSLYTQSVDSWLQMPGDGGQMQAAAALLVH